MNILNYRAWVAGLLIYIFLSKDLIIFIIKNKVVLIPSLFSLISTFIGIFGGIFLLNFLYIETVRKEIISNSMLYRILYYFFHDE